MIRLMQMMEVMRHSPLSKYATGLEIVNPTNCEELNADPPRNRLFLDFDPDSLRQNADIQVIV